MKIDLKDLYHGAALTQIAEHPSFKALNKINGKYGHYLINTDRRVLVKYCRTRPPWQFTFNPDDILTLRSDLGADGRTFLCLVCSGETVCALDEGEIRQVLEINRTHIQWVRVGCRVGGRLRVSGSRGELRRTVPHNAFPAKLFPGRSGMVVLP